VWRVYGPALGDPVALLDVAKGLVPALVGVKMGGDWVGVLAGAAAMVGHARPLFLRFSKGGKMVATAGGVALALAPLAALACMVVWLAVFAAFRYASLASIVTASALPFACLGLGAPWPVVGFAAVAAVGVLVLHRHNIRRLLAGSEPRFSGRLLRGAR
jgi:glycerol-3-phosphate acyltransferase PlsY